MANFYKDNEDLRFYARSWIDWAQLVPLSEAEMRAEGSFERTFQKTATCS